MARKFIFCNLTLYYHVWKGHNTWFGNLAFHTFLLRVYLHVYVICHTPLAYRRVNLSNLWLQNLILLINYFDSKHGLEKYKWCLICLLCSFLQALQLLNFLVVDSRNDLKEAIGSLDPFPDTLQFKQINRSYKNIRKDRTSLNEV